MRLSRSPRVPEDVRAAVEPDRPLAAVPTEDGWAVATARDLVLVAEGGIRLRATWLDMLSGRWDGERRRLHITWVDGTRPALTLALDTEDVTRFAVTVRERIQSSLVHTVDETLPGGARARVHVRRTPAGTMLSQLTVEGALRDDADRRALDRLEAEARAAVGLDT